MSASLVGSEMCIRDRPSALSTRCASRPGPLRARSRRRAGTISAAGWAACLLYTSDAADDM
eukprot:9919059-Alexandrium_andersonii.AAC.1